MPISDLRAVRAFKEPVARAVWTAFWQDSGETPDDLSRRVDEALGPWDLPVCFVAHEGSAFLGTVSLIRSDLAVRPALTPWVAALVVEPGRRGQGTGSALVDHVTAAGFALGFRHLFFSCLEERRPFYERLGWRIHEDGVPRVDMCIMARSAT
jgi:GNAT superfamily N-acetyltransferase